MFDEFRRVVEIEMKQQMLEFFYATIAHVSFHLAKEKHDIRTWDGSSRLKDDILSADESLFIFEAGGASDVTAACCVDIVAYRISSIG